MVGVTLKILNCKRGTGLFLLLCFFFAMPFRGAAGEGTEVQKVDCTISANEHQPPISEGEWVLRCRYQDAQPQYLQNSLARILSQFSPEPLEANGFAKSFEYLEDPSVRNAIFDAFGFYFDERNKNRYLPAGLNTTKEVSAPVMVDPTGKVAVSRFAFAKKNKASLSVNCLICHTSIVPSKVDGVPTVSFATPNVFIDLQKIHEAFQGDLQAREQAGYPGSGSIGHAVERNPRGNSFVNTADYYGVLAALVRNPYPRINKLMLVDYLFASPESSARVDALREVAQAQPFLKTQSWGNYRYKRAVNKLYTDGGLFGSEAIVTYRLGFSLMADGSDYERYVKEFDEQVPPYLKKVESPPYPFPVNQDRGLKGHQIYERRCAECHGSFERGAERWSLNSYPGVIVEDIGTDDQRYKFFTEVLPQFSEWPTMKSNGTDYQIGYNKGYIAPPLVGIWARAPYLHNGSVATLRQLLGKPALRFGKFGLWPRPAEHRFYDQTNIGWKAVDLSSMSALEIAEFKQSAKENQNLRVYDPTVKFQIFDKKTVPGLKNVGHDLGAAPFSGYLTPEETDALLEFLKMI
jgi:hypothetical protein